MFSFSMTKHPWRNKNLQMIDITQINPNPEQPRRYFDEYELNSLAESIKHNGLIQPISVQRIDGGYQIIAGERRLRAGKLAGLRELPCIVHYADEITSVMMSLVENMQRCNLTIFEEAEAISRAIFVCGFSQQEIAERLGMAQSTLSNKLRLLRLNDEERNRIFAAQLSERHARALVRIDSPIVRKSLLDKIIADQLSVKDTEKLINEALAPEQPLQSPPKRVVIVKDVRLFVNSITKMVNSMRQSGVEATTKKKETDDYIEYTVTIPKKLSHT